MLAATAGSRGPRAGTLLRCSGLALLAGGLTQIVLSAPLAGASGTYLGWLAQHAVAGWVAALVWLALLLGRRVVAFDETELLLTNRVAFGLTIAVLLGVVVSPFVTRHFMHLTHPALAVAGVWTLWPYGEWLWGQVRTWAQRRRWDRDAARGTAASVAAPTVGFGEAPWVAAALVAVVVFAQTYHRHLWFGSGGKDLGLFHQSVWLLAHFSAPHNTVMGMTAFADHLEWIDLLAAPLQWLWPRPGALLLFEAVFVGGGAAAVFDLARRKLGSRAAGWAFVAVYLLSIDMQNAVMFDWNPTTCAAGILPWVVWSFEDERPVVFGLSLALLALAKENMVLYGLGLCFALSLGVRGRRRRWALAAAALLGVTFVVEMKLILPIFRPAGFRHMQFDQMGNTAGALLWAALRDPLRSLAVLFTPGRKVDGLLVPFSTVAFACFLSPRFVLAFAPAVCERFWSSHSNRWWGFYYGAGIGVLAQLAAIEGLSRLRDTVRWKRWGRMGVGVVLASCLLVASCGSFGPGPLWFWQQSYYTTAADRRDCNAVLQAIPAGASVAAQNHLIPHLSGRRAIYELRRPITSEYVALDLVQSAWPFGQAYPRQLAHELLQHGYGVVACRGAALVLRRGAASVPCAALFAHPGG